jgi:hypothetical protein
MSSSSNKLAEQTMERAQLKALMLDPAFQRLSNSFHPKIFKETAPKEDK